MRVLLSSTIALLLLAAPAPAQIGLSQPCESAKVNVEPDGSRMLGLCGFNSAVEITRAPAHGQLSPQVRRSAQMRYTPHPGYTGPDSFAFRHAGSPASVPDAEMTIQVTEENGAPYCDIPAITHVQSGRQVHFNGCEDPDEGDSLRVRAVQHPQHGRLGRSGNRFYYDAAAGYVGSDSFVLRADDGALSSPDVAVQIAVGPVAPVECEDHTLIVKKNGTRRVWAPCPPPGSIYEADFISGLLHGGLLRPMTGLLYAPDRDFVGTDEMTFRGVMSSDMPRTEPLKVTFDVTEEGNPPRCHELAGVLQVRSGSTTDAGVFCYDDDIGDRLEFSVPQKPYRGAVVPGSFVYTSDAGYVGADRFSVRAFDGILGTTLMQKIRIMGPQENTAPTCGPTPAAELYSGQAFIEYRCVDEEQDALTVELGQPAHGTVTKSSGFSGPAITYTPGPDYVDGDRFTYRVADGHGGKSAAMTVRIVTAAEDLQPPVCPIVKPRTIRPQTPASVYLQCSSSPLQPPPAPTVVDGPDHGTLVQGDYSSYFTYTPAAGYTGRDEMTLRVSNAAGHTDRTFVFDVSDTANAAPICFRGKEITTRAAATFGLHCYDPDGDAVSHTLSAPPAHGTVSGNAMAGTATYTPASGFAGEDLAEYTVTDGRGGSATVAQVFRVRGETQNVLPRCEGNTYTTPPDQPVQLYPVCLDADNDPLTYEIVSGPQHGLFEAVGPASFRYTPNGGLLGRDAVTLRADDGRGKSAPVTVGINVSGTIFTPGCRSFVANVAPDAARPLTLACPFGATGWTLEIAQAPEHGTLSAIAGDGTVTYTPHPGYRGPDAFAYRVRKDDRVGEPALVTLDVHEPAPLPDDVVLDRLIGPAPPGPEPSPEPTAEPTPVKPEQKPPTTQSPVTTVVHPPSTATVVPPIAAPDMRQAALQAMRVALRAVVADLGGAQAFLPAQDPKLGKKEAKLLAIGCAQGCDVRVKAKLVAGRRSVKLRDRTAAVGKGRAVGFGYRVTSADRRRLRNPRRAAVVFDVTVRDADGRTHRSQIRLRLTLR
jgi:hypothetical protein